MALNPNEAPEGFVAVEAFNCDGCALGPMYSDACVQFPCAASNRDDRCDVMFIRKPVKSLIWPYDSEGTPVEVTG